MPKRLFILLIISITATSLITGCAPDVVYGSPPPPPPAPLPPSPPPPPPDVVYAPPPPIYEVPPPPPFYGAIWIGGSYYRYHSGWRWRHGYYRH